MKNNNLPTTELYNLLINKVFLSFKRDDHDDIEEGIPLIISGLSIYGEFIVHRRDHQFGQQIIYHYPLTHNLLIAVQFFNQIDIPMPIRFIQLNTKITGFVKNLGLIKVVSLSKEFNRFPSNLETVELTITSLSSNLNKILVNCSYLGKEHKYLFNDAFVKTILNQENNTMKKTEIKVGDKFMHDHVLFTVTDIFNDENRFKATGVTTNGDNRYIDASLDDDTIEWLSVPGSNSLHDLINDRNTALVHSTQGTNEEYLKDLDKRIKEFNHKVNLLCDK